MDMTVVRSNAPRARSRSARPSDSPATAAGHRQEAVDQVRDGRPIPERRHLLAGQVRALGRYPKVLGVDFPITVQVEDAHVVLRAQAVVAGLLLRFFAAACLMAVGCLAGRGGCGSWFAECCLRDSVCARFRRGCSCLAGPPGGLRSPMYAITHVVRWLSARKSRPGVWMAASGGNSNDRDGSAIDAPAPARARFSTKPVILHPASGARVEAQSGLRQPPSDR